MELIVSELDGLGVLIVEDDLMLRKQLSGFLRSKGAEVEAAANLAAARKLSSSRDWDVLLLDVCLPDGNGLDFLAERTLSENTLVIVMTATGGMDTVIQALRQGAADYLSKPFDLDELPFIIERAAKHRRVKRIECFQQNQGRNQQFLLDGLGDELSRKLQDILDADFRLKLRLPPILIEGETGTGKTSLARWIHAKGPRLDAPFIDVNCSTLPDSLAESELFGHEKGAFTDAKQARIGLFEAANGGTLFLDEVTSLSPGIQAKILTAIEDGVVRRLGAQRSIKVNVRLITAALPELAERVRNGSFREDLYHRLNLLHLKLPPLRERKAMILPIAETIIQQLSRRYGRQNMRLSDRSKQKLLQNEWPGNVRELSHELERAFIFASEEEIEVLKSDGEAKLSPQPSSLLNPNWTLPENDYQFEQDLQQLTLHVIRMAMSATEGNISAAARLLGVPRDFIRYRISEK
jgi:two-component system, NtrC family, response regulator AtoC